MYVRFFHTDAVGKQAQAVGTDSYLPLDGRWNIESCHLAAQRQSRRLARVQHYTGYQIYHGQLRDADRPACPVIQFDNQ